MNTTYTEIESKLYGHFRFTVIAWCCALPVMYSLLIWLTSLCDEQDRHWLAITCAPTVCASIAIGSMWACTRFALTSAQKRLSESVG